MIIEIDFNSDEAIYIQLCNQIILGIATSQFREGEQLPSVRQLAETIGINMHTVNKAYSIGLNGGMIGSRMTGGGFGGCTVSLVFRHALEAIQEALENDYFARTGIHTTSFATRPAAGAMVLPTP